MEKEIQAAWIGVFGAVIGGVVGAIVGAVIALIASRKSDKLTRRLAIDEMILKLIEFSIEHPHLEQDSYAASYPKCPETPKNGKERYENFCCFVFNVIESIFYHCDGDEKTMDRILHVEELIRRHCTWWSAQPDNVDGYRDDKFRAYVHKICDKVKPRVKP